LELRDARADDADAITAIYNHYILHSSISFEEEAVNAATMAQRVADTQQAGLPWLVCLIDGQVIGYAYASKWRVRPAYRFAVESSVYLGTQWSGRGAGTALYAALIARLRALELHLVIGGIALPNPASVALHEKMGFAKVAHFSEVGRKFERWVDVGYWQLPLAHGAPSP
jgi:L-amino acid N-acyltransferase YncA